MSQRGLMVDSVGAVLVAFASCRAALSLGACWAGAVSALDVFQYSKSDYGYEEFAAASFPGLQVPINLL